MPFSYHLWYIIRIGQQNRPVAMFFLTEREKRMFERVKKIIVNQLDVDESQVTLDSSFVDDLGADSLDIVELIMALEQEFDIEIPDEDAEKIATVNDAVQYVTSNIK